MSDTLWCARCIAERQAQAAAPGISYEVGALYGAVTIYEGTALCAGHLLKVAVS